MRRGGWVAGAALAVSNSHGNRAVSTTRRPQPQSHSLVVAAAAVVIVVVVVAHAAAAATAAPTAATQPTRLHDVQGGLGGILQREATAT